MITSFHIQITSLGVPVPSHEKCLGSHKYPTMIMSPCVLIWFSAHGWPKRVQEQNEYLTLGNESSMTDSWVNITVSGGKEGARERVLVLSGFECWLFYSELWWSTPCAQDFIILDSNLIKCYRLHLGSSNLRIRIKMLEEASFQHSYNLEH